MIRHFRLFLSLIKINLSLAMEYRGDFLVAVVMNVMWVFLQLWTMKVYFSFTDSILGWKEAEVFVLIGFVRLIKGIFDLFVRRNIFSFPEEINRGSLDYNLTRPVNSLFLVSTRYHIFNEVSTLAFGMIIFSWSLWQIGFEITIGSLITIFSMLFYGFIVYYCVQAAFMMIAFYVTRLSAISDFHEVYSQSMRYPTEVFSKGNFLLLLLLIPIYATATLPTKIILGKVSSELIFLQAGFTAILFAATYGFWIFSLRHYSSASS